MHTICCNMLVLVHDGNVWTGLDIQLPMCLFLIWWHTTKPTASHVVVMSAYVYAWPCPKVSRLSVYRFVLVSVHAGNVWTRQGIQQTCILPHVPHTTLSESSCVVKLHQYPGRGFWLHQMLWPDMWPQLHFWYSCSNKWKAKRIVGGKVQQKPWHS